MPQTHKLVRDAVEALLAAEADGFNAQLATTLSEYGINAAIALDWSSPGAGVLRARIPEGRVNLTHLKGSLTLQFATEGSQWTGETRGIQWSGLIGLRMIFRLTYSLKNDKELLAEDEAEAVAEAIEDTVIRIFQRRTGNGFEAYPGLVYARPPDCPEGYTFDAQGTGYIVVIPMRVAFRIDAEYAE